MKTVQHDNTNILDRYDVACVDCGKPFSNAWPSDGPSRRDAAIRTMKANGWAEVWGAWRCRECRVVRQERRRAMAPYVRAAAVVMAGVCAVMVAVQWGVVV